MTRSTIIGAGLAAAILLGILVVSGGSSAPKAMPAPQSVQEAPLQKVAFMTDPKAAEAAKPAEPAKAPAPAH